MGILAVSRMDVHIPGNFLYITLMVPPPQILLTGNRFEKVPKLVETIYEVM